MGIRIGKKNGNDAMSSVENEVKEVVAPVLDAEPELKEEPKKRKSKVKKS